MIALDVSTQNGRSHQTLVMFEAFVQISDDCPDESSFIGRYQL